ncbi:hypothetical protein DYB28_001671 [Aphanomyces astaci]|uniref:Uncharacterized protein n=1 Tax=Aphanomyces astaci TaxID=112090 RepID=A0A397D957_APHAT|nr:hypothetical protein DYB25_005623 [Aphanomyces astaci]RHY57682.1 hypothetical protein DYB38_006087 [Aphanomyces astaci]RHY65297.1 hypothetical protein DYB30_006642 [Aphanomyces astaci]RHY98916.1 hypothetical protein DYB31_006374 [Aphanomyces astaci]RLN79379.1 hypothetical protein DYB28_001671 [Aphanomyces astaci]
MSTLRSRLAKAIAASHAPPLNTMSLVQQAVAECKSQYDQITVKLRVFDVVAAKKKTGEEIGKRVYLIDEEATPADWDDLQTLSDYDRKEFCLSVMVFTNQVAKIAPWNVGDIVQLSVKDLKLYDGKQCQALFVDVQYHQARSTSLTATMTSTVSKQSDERDLTYNSQDTSNDSKSTISCFGTIPLPQVLK